MKAWGAALLAGLLISLGLLWLMQAMLMGESPIVKKSERLAMIDFVRLKPAPPKKTPKPPEKQVVKKVEQLQPVVPEKVVEKVKRKPPPKKAEPRTKPKVVVAKKIAPVAPKLNLPIPVPASTAPVISQPVVSHSVKSPVKVEHEQRASVNKENQKRAAQQQQNKEYSSSGVIALTRVQPKYPRRALSRHIEGEVTLAFTISPRGIVTNPEVVHSKPAGVFDTAAIDAIKKWTFKQKIVNGVSVEQRAEQTLKFKLAAR